MGGFWYFLLRWRRPGRAIISGIDAVLLAINRLARGSRFVNILAVRIVSNGVNIINFCLMVVFDRFGRVWFWIGRYSIEFKDRI